MTAEDLLSELRSSRTDLARLVEAAAHDRHTRLVVPQRSVEAWERPGARDLDEGQRLADRAAESRSSGSRRGAAARNAAEGRKWSG